MPTAVSAARLCLAGEAAAALDEAVAIARRRGHAQTTSLHVVSGLLSLPASSSSLFRDALSRARSAAYSPRLQFKALELCFAVALDRLPSGPPSGGNSDAQHHAAETEPLVSNSLMAAIKRSQANQRRNPDTFHLYQHYQQQQQQSSPMSVVKVELQQLLLSILDDPIVSRVFGEAGFRGYDIKFAILHPPPSVLRFPRASRCPPLFLCNFPIDADESDLTPSCWGFPFAGQPLSYDGVDDNCRRVADVLLKKQGRNPLLVGVGASDAARDFERAVGRQKWTAFPSEVRGIKFFSIEKEVAEFLGGGRERPWLDSRFSEIALWLAAEECGSSPGIILSFGDLKGMVDVVGEGKRGDGLDRVSYIVSELTKMVHGHPGKLWLMGSAATYETYMKLLSQFPSVDKDWDLQLLPITSLKPGSGCLLPRHNSVMESLAPFGSLFPVTSNSVVPMSKQSHSILCHMCSDKCEEEVAVLLKDLSAEIGLPSEPHQNELTSVNSSFDAEKDQDDGPILNAKLLDLRRKWYGICHSQHQGGHTVMSPFVPGRMTPSNPLPVNIDEPPVKKPVEDPPSVALDLQKIPLMSCNLSFSMASEFKSGDLLLNQLIQPSHSEQLKPNGFASTVYHSDLSAPDELTSPSSVSSVSTDLMLGTVNASPAMMESPKLRPHHLTGDLTSKVDVTSRNVSVQFPFCSVPDSPSLSTNPVQITSDPKFTTPYTFSGDWQNVHPCNERQKLDIRDFKTIYKSLAEKVSWQEEAIRSISNALIHCRSGVERLQRASLRGDIWFTFLGPDKVGKRKLSMALAELLFGSSEKLICIDLCPEDSLVGSNHVCSSAGMKGSDLNFRGKTVVDHIAEEIRKKPVSVVLLESIDKADYLVQRSLSYAIRTGKFSDSHGGETGINDVVFVMTAETVEGLHMPYKENIRFPEERILAVKARQMKISTGAAPDSLGGVNFSSSGHSVKGSSGTKVFISKRKLDITQGTRQCEAMGTPKRANKAPSPLLDLNLPAEDVLANNVECRSTEKSSTSETPGLWMKEILAAVDETVIFKPFDLDGLAEEVIEELDKIIQSALGSSKCVLEIDQEVMEQILAAAWLSDGRGSLNGWLEQVLFRSFVEAGQSRHFCAPPCVLRLVSRDAAMEDHPPGTLLPSRILLQ